MNVCMLALMVLVPSHSVPITGAPCIQNGYTKAWNELLKPVSIANDDTRYGLHEGGPKYGLTSAERSWVAQTTGRVVCPGNKDLGGVQGSGALVGRNDLIITNVHVIRNADGSKRSDWPSCYFETQATPPVRKKLMFFDPGTIFGTRDLSRGRQDYALIRLEGPIDGVEPLPIASNLRVQVGQSLIVISAIQHRMKSNRKVLFNEPVIQSCEVQTVFAANEESGSMIRSNCSGTEGSSGSILLQRDEKNRLVAVGVHTGGGGEEFDGRPYSADRKGNNSQALIFDGVLQEDIQRSLGIQSSL